MLIALDTAKPGCYRVRLLESKGTQEEPLARHQMRKAVRQLGSHIINPLPDGIAVSSVTYGDQIRFFAVETRGKGEASYRPNWKTKDVRWGADERSWSADNGGIPSSCLAGDLGSACRIGGNVEAHSTWSGPREEDADAYIDVRERSEVKSRMARLSE